ncbi:MAG: TrkH family potassium uptake protein [Fusobacteria bacterium]|nr:TrkH family potassium uptake protein [Fusobacteriota bacterium]
MKFIYNYLKDMDFVSKLLILLGIVLLVPLLMLIPYPEDYIYASNFIIPALASMVIGVLFRSKKSGEYQSKFFGRNHESVVVVGIWLYAFVLGAMPFFLSGQLDFVNALFEAVSGWTTSGLSVMYLEEVPRIFMFYRGFMQFCGGLGFVLLMLVFASGGSAMELFSAEGHPDKLEPNLRSTAKTMMYIYVGSNIIGVILYIIFGMPWFDAIFHSMASLSTGGFGMTSASLAAYDSLPIEIITIVLMIIGATNFAILALLIKGKFKNVFRIGEMRFFTVLLIIGIPLVAFTGIAGLYTNLGESFRIAFFQVVSGLSTTGFATVDFNTWEPNMLLIVIISMIIGGGAGSTAGGIKYTRIYALYKSFVFNVRKKFMPERTVNEAYIHKTEGKVYLSNGIMEEVGRFTFVYMVIYFIGVIMLTFADIPLDKAMFEFASALGTVGLSIGVTAPGTSNYVLIIEMIGMLLGRLEIFIVLVSVVAVISKTFGKIFKR